MRWITRLSYAVGQTQKDLVGSVLNAFVIIYFERCLSIRNVEVGTLLLCGQIVNAISTPLIGYLSDRAVSAAHQSKKQPKTQTKLMQYLSRTTYFEPSFRLRTRKSWHFYGSLLMTIAFPCIFGQPKQAAGLPMWAKLIINGILIIVVQVSQIGLESASI
ncbi:Major facilitator superfamily domain-containing protein 12 [Fasciolopsis buskii]|uniref:Major facilitator superfamily domain-containing protein 12 n=1 Tax=Fasciolopsis buskii TaxID=27845 RepID=A0A8E0RYR2_9TREM|nr:Major facilitator superfamily domain-containing protein 12 [Fasciolopsis buski]